jgi:hypothetical protein
MKRKALFLVLLALTLLATSAQAMSSTNYKLEWYVPMTGGGGAAASANYAVNFTVGQTAVGNMASANYSLELGFWAGIGPSPVYLPLILNNYNMIGP